jgi:O-antigen ligase
MAAAAPALRAQPAGNSLAILAAAGLVAFAAACGVAIAYGELGAFYVTLSLTLCIGVLYDFRIGAVVLLVLVPFGATNLMPHSVMGVPGLNPLNILVAATLGSFLIRGERLGALAPRALLWLYAAPILFAGWIGMDHWDDILPYFYETLAVNFTGPGSYFRETAVRPLMIVLAALMVGAAVAKSQKPERFLVALAISVWILALVEIGFILSSGIHFALLASPGARSFFNEMGLHANDLGRLFAVAYGLMLFTWWETKSPGLKTFLFVTMGVAAFAMVLSFSRAAYLGFFLVNAMFLAWKFNAKTVALALLAVAVVALLAPQYVYSRIMYGFASGDANAVSANRLEGIWMPLLPELFNSPPWGNGLGSIMWSFPMLTGGMDTVGHPHNAYIEAILDMGVIGLALILAYFWHVWKGFRALGSNAYLTPEMRGLFQGGAAALLCFLITGWAGSSLRPVEEFAYLWLVIGIMYGVLARRPAG